MGGRSFPLFVGLKLFLLNRRVPCTGNPSTFHLRVIQCLSAVSGISSAPFSSHTKMELDSAPATSTEKSSTKLIRNIALIAHIDAGKTTTTERMLYCARRIRYLGEVDRGDTVTDYLPEERSRGITIVCTAACMNWRRHTFNLLDTPGHVDFTWEVERCLPVLDGAITILDGTKGVQAQTQTVWRQAAKYNLPRLVFINKLDRPTANLNLCLSSLSGLAKWNSIETRYVPIHWPVYSEDLMSSNSISVGKPLSLCATRRMSVTSSESPKVRTAEDQRGRFIGLVDLTSMHFQNSYHCKSAEDLPFIQDLLHLDANTSSRHDKQPNPSLPSISVSSMKAVLQARTNLLCQLAELDDHFADIFLAQESPELVLPTEPVRAAVRRATCSEKLTPVLLGSSRRSIGVQPLMDAMLYYLPDPSMRPAPNLVSQLVHHLTGGIRQQSLLEENPDSLWQSALQLLYQHEGHSELRNQPIMLVFKVIFDPHRGPLSLVRVYTGTVQPGCQVSNWSQCNKGSLVERVLNVLQLTGEQQEDINSAGPGSIVALTGLQTTHSGDLLGPVLKYAKRTTSRHSKHLQQEATGNSAHGRTRSGGTGDAEDSKHQLETANPPVFDLPGSQPDPVVYAAIEPASLSVVRPLEEALICMHREDPSFQAKLDRETGQWKISGMGDLHLEVSMSRLRRHYKVDARIGPMLIAYRESPTARRGNHVKMVNSDDTTALGFSRLCGSVDGHETAVVAALMVEAVDTDRVQVVFDRKCFGHQSSLVPSPSGSHERLLQVVRTACQQALESGGPLLRSPVVGVKLHVQQLIVGRPFQVPKTLDELSHNSPRAPSNLYWLPVTTQTAMLALLKSTVIASVRNALGQLSTWSLMEPMMRVELRLPVDETKDRLSHFLGDLSARRAEIVSVDSACDLLGSRYQHQIIAVAPLAELVGYSAAIRSLSSGRADLHLQFVDYRAVEAEHQAHLLGRLRWTAGSSKVDVSIESDDDV